jgi:hypothetical protein
MTATVVLSLRLRRFRRFSFPYRIRLPRYSTGGGLRPSADQTRRESVGIATRRSSTRVSARCCLHRACCVFAGRPLRLGPECRSRSSRARLIFFRRPRAPYGAQHSRARSASLFNHLADARCEGAFWRGAHVTAPPCSFRLHREKSHRVSDRPVLTKTLSCRTKCHAEACRPVRSMTTLRRSPQ